MKTLQNADYKMEIYQKQQQYPLNFQDVVLVLAFINFVVDGLSQTITKYELQKDKESDKLVNNYLFIFNHFLNKAQTDSKILTSFAWSNQNLTALFDSNQFGFVLSLQPTSIETNNVFNELLKKFTDVYNQALKKDELPDCFIQTKLFSSSTPSSSPSSLLPTISSTLLATCVSTQINSMQHIYNGFCSRYLSISETNPRQLLSPSSSMSLNNKSAKPLHSNTTTPEDHNLSTKRFIDDINIARLELACGQQLFNDSDFSSLHTSSPHKDHVKLDKEPNTKKITPKPPASKHFKLQKKMHEPMGYHSTTIDREIFSTLTRSKTQLTKNIATTADSQVTLAKSNETLQLLREEASIASEASSSSVRYTEKYEKKAMMEKYFVRWSFLFFMGISLYIVIKRLLFFFTPVVYISKPIFESIRMIQMIFFWLLNMLPW